MYICSSMGCYDTMIYKCSLTIFSSTNISFEKVPWRWRCGDVCRFG